MCCCCCSALLNKQQCVLTLDSQQLNKHVCADFWMKTLKQFSRLKTFIWLTFNHRSELEAKRIREKHTRSDFYMWSLTLWNNKSICYLLVFQSKIRTLLFWCFHSLLCIYYYSVCCLYGFILWVFISCVLIRNGLKI